MDIIWSMRTIQKSAANTPLNSPVLAAALNVLFKASAMGLIKGPIDIFRLDFPAVKTYMKKIASAGIGKAVLQDVEHWDTISPDELLKKLKKLSDFLEESPNPNTEWNLVRQYIPDNLLAGLIDISSTSIQRYSLGETQNGRPTPDDVAGRLHFLALVIGDLAGAYNDEGIRQWFTKPRKQAFNGAAPIDLLAGDWKPDQSKPLTVRNFARSLTHSAAT